MSLHSLNDKMLARLNHVDSQLHVDWEVTGRLSSIPNRIVNLQHNYKDLFLMLQSYCIAKAISGWFHTGDLNAVKAAFYNYSKLEYICAQPPYNALGDAVPYENMALFGMFYLVSDCEPLIQWYARQDYRFIKTKVNNVKSYGYFTQQFFHALRGEWGILKERCEYILANPPTTSREKKYLIDHQFYLALAKGDSDGMTAAIKELVIPKNLAKRASLEDGYTEDLLCTPALIYCKLAWRNGYEITVESPYLPQEWLPVKPLEKYEDAFEFMRTYKIGSV